MDRILIIVKKNGTRASSVPLLGLFSITCSNMFIGIYDRSQVSVYMTFGPLVYNVLMHMSDK